MPRALLPNTSLQNDREEVERAARILLSLRDPQQVRVVDSSRDRQIIIGHRDNHDDDETVIERFSSARYLQQTTLFNTNVKLEHAMIKARETYDRIIQRNKLDWPRCLIMVIPIANDRKYRPHDLRGKIVARETHQELLWHDHPKNVDMTSGTIDFIVDKSCVISNRPRAAPLYHGALRETQAQEAGNSQVQAMGSYRRQPPPPRASRLSNTGITHPATATTRGQRPALPAMSRLQTANAGHLPMPTARASSRPNLQAGPNTGQNANSTRSVSATAQYFSRPNSQASLRSQIAGPNHPTARTAHNPSRPSSRSGPRPQSAVGNRSTTSTASNPPFNSQVGPHLASTDRNRSTTSTTQNPRSGSLAGSRPPQPGFGSQRRRR